MSKILIIEDDLDINEVLKLYLENAQYDVYTAMTLLDGEKLLNEISPDLILLDVDLPDGNGFEFAKKIRKQTNAILIFVTVHHYIDQKLQGLKSVLMTTLQSRLFQRKSLHEYKHIFAEKETTLKIKLLY